MSEKTISIAKADATAVGALTSEGNW